MDFQLHRIHIFIGRQLGSIYLYFYCILLFHSCTQNCEIRQLTDEEKISRALRAEFVNRDVPIYDVERMRISRDSIEKKYDRDLYALRTFVDCGQKVHHETIVPITENDKEVRHIIDSLYKNRIDLLEKRLVFLGLDSELIEFNIQTGKLISLHECIPIPCTQIDSILFKIYTDDQTDRENSEMGTFLNRDLKRGLVLKSMIENCGFDEIKKLGSDHVYKAFIILQHSIPQMQERYISYFRGAARMNLLKLSTLALLEDRILVRSGQNQLYGTQFRIDEDAILFYPVSQNVDSLRESMNLGPWKEYINKISNIYPDREIVVQ